MVQVGAPRRVRLAVGAGVIRLRRRCRRWLILRHAGKPNSYLVTSQVRLRYHRTMMLRLGRLIAFGMLYLALAAALIAALSGRAQWIWEGSL